MPDDVLQMIEDIDLLFNDWVEQCDIVFEVEDTEEMMTLKKQAKALLLRKKALIKAMIEDVWKDFAPFHEKMIEL